MARQLRPVDVARLRLHAQNILESAVATPVDAVHSMLAMQGQDLPGTLWAIGLRAQATEQEVRRAFDSGELVRSWPMRGTLHALTPQDLRLILPLSRDRLVSSLAARHRELGIEANDVTAARRAAEAELSTASPALTRKELFAVFERAGQLTAGQRGAHLIFLLAHAGVLCLGPFRGKEQTFVLLDVWAPALGQLPGRDEALAAVALRYFLSHGPATVEDFAWWTKLTLTDARAGAAAARSQLAELSVGGREYLASPQIGELATRIPGARSTLALPGFDEYILGYTDRSAALAAEHSELIVPGNNGMFKSTLVAGGRVIGTWSRTERAQTIDVHGELFREITDTEAHGLVRSLESYGRFRGKAVTVTTSVKPMARADAATGG
ncbi:winged helix DNA-binding domain-containing protein [Mycetocola zhadangensis]|uniref:Winged helix DNA-binding domain-containing protein n=1 Tax=Mycetocola zhadangensis TaxID=1164595 RepID=A0A3L7J5P8_9MICO|nr:winged helix DNA-binding domain-containing protein [Mycetocola zhadangensis]RLQ85977.1 winged helix DNA-binding domain-containing protein [Mycetocola zhadangensis]GGE87330.1 hypothetical protein GCM10011313_07410 [Mycetocola zhadangensis]